MSKPEAYTINIDGAARGNPGPAAFAYVIRRPDGTMIRNSGCLGTATNNVAEYTALINALTHAVEIKIPSVMVRSDSELLVKQMTGLYKVKNDALRELYQEAKGLAKLIPHFAIEHVRRAENSEADKLCNEALDAADPKAGQKAKPQRHRQVRAAARQSGGRVSQVDRGNVEMGKPFCRRREGEALRG